MYHMCLMTAQAEMPFLRDSHRPAVSYVSAAVVKHKSCRPGPQDNYHHSTSSPANRFTHQHVFPKLRQIINSPPPCKHTQTLSQAGLIPEHTVYSALRCIAQIYQTLLEACCPGCIPGTAHSANRRMLSPHHRIPGSGMLRYPQADRRHEIG